MKKIILASSSPRRKQLLEQIGLAFDIDISRYEEDMQAKDDPYELAKLLALEKGKEVAKRYRNAIIISADTFIVFQGVCIGKPKDAEDAKSILRAYSGNTITVISGYAIIDTDNDTIINDYGEASVTFRQLSQDEIDDYVATSEPLDKAGAYNIHEKGAVLVQSIEGDYFSIVGLPLTKIYQGLKQLGINTFKQSQTH